MPFRPILPIVFYTGQKRWPTIVELAKLIDVPQALERFVPHHDILFMNLNTKSDAELVSGNHPFGWMLRVLQKESASKAEFIEALTAAVERLTELPDEERNQWAKLMYYLILLICHRRKKDEREELIAVVTEAVEERALQEEVRKMGQTSAQAWMEQGEKRGRKEGEKRGRKEGELKAKQDILLKLMQTKFGAVSPAIIQKVKAIRNARRLDDLLERGFTASTIEEIGIE